jgi:hypothetical protein
MKGLHSDVVFHAFLGRLNKDTGFTVWLNLQQKKHEMTLAEVMLQPLLHVTTYQETLRGLVSGRIRTAELSPIWVEWRQLM